MSPRTGCFNEEAQATIMGFKACAAWRRAARNGLIHPLQASCRVERGTVLPLESGRDREFDARVKFQLVTKQGWIQCVLLGYRLPPESDGYDGDGQGGQFGASAASPPRNARRRRKKCEFMSPFSRGKAIF